MAKIYHKANEHPKFATFKYILTKKGMDIKTIARKIGSSRANIYNLFMWNRSKKIEELFEILKKMD